MTDNSDRGAPNQRRRSQPYEAAARLIGYVVSKFREYRTEKENEKPQDRAARRTANATRAIAAFTIVLAGVGYYQWRELRNSNRINRDIYVAGERARIGPSGANIVGELKEGAPFQIDIFYGNTGRDAADTYIFTDFGMIDSGAWSGDQNKEYFVRFQEACMSKQPVSGQGTTTYPTTGTAAYSNHLDTAETKNPKFLGPKEFFSGDKTMTVQGCIVYSTLGQIHHSAFCFFYQIAMRPRGLSMPYCPFGQRAD